MRRLASFRIHSPYAFTSAAKPWAPDQVMRSRSLSGCRADGARSGLGFPAWPSGSVPLPGSGPLTEPSIRRRRAYNGQSLSTLSGGEAQRLKLAAELTKTGNTYLMDEPSTGLHRLDIDWLLDIIDRLINIGNTVIIVEHNLDIISAADWIIDIGPEGGKNGGTIIATGTPETIATHHQSYTGQYLKTRLDTA